MSLQLAFWLLVIFGMLAYALLARSSPNEIDARRRAFDAEQRRVRAQARDRAAAAKAAPIRNSAHTVGQPPGRTRQTQKRPRKRRFKWPLLRRSSGRR